MEFLKQDSLSKTGYFSLEWKSKPDEYIRLYQKKHQEDWILIYEGTGNRISLSGLPNGKYEYAACPSDASVVHKTNCKFETIEVVHYNSLETISILGIGFFLFGSILFFLWNKIYSKSEVKS